MNDALPPLALLLLQIAVVVAVARGLSRLLRAVGQPAVIAEIVAGIVLGPSVLGLWWPAAFELLFPAASLPSVLLVRGR
jgi:Kef-type K+ transport system membrane component KefB